MAARNEFMVLRAVIVTTDCGAGMDDQWTVAHLALTPEIDLCGNVTTRAPRNCLKSHGVANLAAMRRIIAWLLQASSVVGSPLSSLPNHRFRPGQATVRSTTQRRGRRVGPTGMGSGSWPAGPRTQRRGRLTTVSVSPRSCVAEGINDPL